MTGSIISRAASAIRIRLTPRARLGVVALCAVAWLVAYLELVSNVAASESRLENMRADLAVRRAAVSQNELMPELARARTAIDAFKAGIPVAATVGLASAEIQSEIEAALRSSGLSDARVTVQIDEQVAGVVVFEVEVEGRDPGAAFVEVLRKVSLLERPSIPIVIDWFAANQRIRIILRMSAEVRSEG